MSLGPGGRDQASFVARWGGLKGWRLGRNSAARFSDGRRFDANAVRSRVLIGIAPRSAHPALATNDEADARNEFGLKRISAP